MNKWSFKLNSDLKEVSKTMKTALGSVNGFVFNMN